MRCLETSGTEGDQISEYPSLCRITSGLYKVSPKFYSFKEDKCRKHWKKLVSVGFTLLNFRVGSGVKGIGTVDEGQSHTHSLTYTESIHGA